MFYPKFLWLIWSLVRYHGNFAANTVNWLAMLYYRVVAKLHPSLAEHLFILLDVMKPPRPLFISNNFLLLCEILANLIKIVFNIQQVLIYNLNIQSQIGLFVFYKVNIHIQNIYNFIRCNYKFKIIFTIHIIFYTNTMLRFSLFRQMIQLLIIQSLCCHDVMH